MEPEIVDQWRITMLASGDGFRALRLPADDPYRSLAVRMRSANVEFESGECFNEEFPRPVIERLFALLDSLVAERDQRRAAIYEVERD